MLAANEFKLLVLTLDTIPPSVYAPTSFGVVTKSASGTRVRFKVRAQDNVDGVLAVKCNHRSGSVFRVGKTRVTCTARDHTGNRGRAAFTVRVVQAKRHR